VSHDDINTIVKNMDQEAAAIKQTCLKLSWYMRGGITYDQTMMLSPDERRMISELAKENIETTKKSGLPWF
jgi:hypothetical protein